MYEKRLKMPKVCPADRWVVTVALITTDSVTVKTIRPVYKANLEFSRGR